MNTKRAPPPPAAKSSVRRAHGHTVSRSYPSHRDVVSKIILPGGEDASHHFTFANRGNPPKPTIVSVSPNCPYDLEVGQTVCAVGIKDEFIMDPSTKFLSDVIHEFNFSDQRTILLQRSPNHVSSHGSNEGRHHHQQHRHSHSIHHHQPNAARSSSARELSNNRSASTTQLHHQRSQSARQLANKNGLSHSSKQARSLSARKVTPASASAVRPGPGKLSLPTGHVGLWFEGSPARLTDVSEGSPIAAEAKGKAGLAVTAIIIPGEIEMYGPISTDDLVDLLNDFSNCQGRVVMFDRLQKIDMAKEVVSKVHLPTKNCSIKFNGKDRNIKVTNVDGDSRTSKKVRLGQTVRRLEFPGESPYFSSVGAKTLNVLLDHHEKTRGKVLVVSHPFARPGANIDELVPSKNEHRQSMKDSIRNSIHLLKEQTKS